MRRFIGGLAMLLALFPAATVAVPAISVAAPASPVGVSAPTLTGSDFNTFNAVSFNSVDGANNDVPYSGPTTTLTAGFDTLSFTIQPGESDSSPAPNYNGCSETPPVFAGRTGWVRFTPGATGRVFVTAVTSTYDSVLMLRKALRVPLGSSNQFSILQGDQDCSDANNGPGNEGAQLAVVPGSSYYVQVGGKCPGDPSTCEAPLVPGGPTTVQLTFIPDDSDGDGIADTVDACPTIAGNASAQGCPDADGDGIRNDNGADNCPSQAGVPAPAPYNGCPAGPTPPHPPPAYVVITGLDGDVDNTNTIAVKLRLNWPQGAQKADITNGDGTFQTVTLGPETIDWQLRPLSGSAASESRLVSVSYRGPGIPDALVVDAITLDTRPPQVPLQRLYPNGDGWILAVATRDRGTGVSRIALLNKTGKTITSRVVCSKSSCPMTAKGTFFTKSTRPRVARVTDAAGNSKGVQLVQRSTSCVDPKHPVYIGKRLNYDCFKKGDRCTKDDGHLWSESGWFRCRLASDGVTRVKAIAPSVSSFFWR